MGDSDASPCSRRPASAAPWAAANAPAVSSFQRYGSTVAPDSTAQQTAEVNRSTSTMTTTSQWGASAARPSGPQSKR